MHYAAVTGHLDRIVDKEYRQQVYLSKDQNGLSAFHKAVANGHKEIAEHLMEKTDRAIVNQVTVLYQKPCALQSISWLHLKLTDHTNFCVII